MMSFYVLDTLQQNIKDPHDLALAGHEIEYAWLTVYSSLNRNSIRLLGRVCVDFMPVCLLI